MTPLARHDKFAERLACSRSQLAVVQRLWQRSGVAWIADGESGDGVPFFGNAEYLANFFVVETCHLVNVKSSRGGFHGEPRCGRADIVLCVPVGSGIFRKG